jgi:hypothetical protein
MRVALNGRRPVSIIFGILISTIAFGQQKPSASPSATTVCTFADGKEMSVRYAPDPVDKKQLPEGKLWKPGGTPVLLFTEASVTAGTSEIPTGAYTMYFIPAKKQWTLVVNKNVDAASEYNEQQDIVRVPMDAGNLPTGTDNLKIVFAHMAPQQCNMRLYRGRIGVWMEFKEK